MLSDLIKIYRVKDWVHFLGLPLLGYFKFNEENPKRLLFILISSAFYLAFAAVLNNWYDRHLDINQSLKNPFSKNFDRFNFYNIRTVIILPLVLTLIFAYLSSTIVFLIMLIGIFFSYSYSSPPFRLKSIPVVGTLSNILVFIPLLYIGPVSIENHYSEMFYLAVFCSFVVIIMQLFHEIEDMEDDQKGKIYTIPVIFGKKEAIHLNQFLAIFFMLYCLLLSYQGFFKMYELFISILYSIAVIFASILQGGHTFGHISYRIIMRTVSCVMGITLLGGFIIL